MGLANSLGSWGEACCSHCTYLSLWADLKDPCQRRGKGGASWICCAGCWTEGKRCEKKGKAECCISGHLVDFQQSASLSHPSGSPKITTWSASCVCLSPRSFPGASGKIRRGSTWPYIPCLSCFHHCAYSGLAQSYLCTVCHACAL